MDHIVEKISLRAALCSLALLASPALAGTIGTATNEDVTLDGAQATVLSYGNGINPQSQGKNGGSTGFNAAFSPYGSGSWTRLAAFGSSADDGVTLESAALGSSLALSFDQQNGRNGTWTLTNQDAAIDVTLDLVFAIHTGGGSGAWLFDGLQIGAGDTLNGNWTLKLLNNGGKYSGYSNLTVFGRNLTATAKAPTVKDPIDPPQDPAVGMPPVEVPEPSAWAMFALGLALLGAMGRKRA